MTLCSNCNTELSDTDTCCPKCGHVNEARPVQTASAVSPSPAPRKKLSGCAIAAIVAGSLFAAIGVIIVIAMILAFSLTAPAVDAIDAHLAAIKQGQIERAYEGTTSGFREVTSLDDYRHFLNSYPILKNVSETSFDERQVEDGVATLKGRVTDSEETIAAFHAQLKKEGESWKVQAIDLPGSQAVEPGPASPPQTAPVTPASPATSGTSAGPGESAVATIVIGAGRNADGSLVNPGDPIPSGTPTISADIALINHPLGERVQVWVEQGQNRTKPVDGVVEGEGSGVMPFELHVGDSAFPAGRYTLVVGLGESKRFTQSFDIK